MEENKEMKDIKLKKKYSLLDFHRMESKEKDNKLLPIKNINLQPNKTTDLTISNKNLPMMTTPRTNIEKIIETLNDIADEFDEQKKCEYKMKTEWVIKEILSNKMYKYENLSENSVEEKFFQFFSPDYEEPIKTIQDITEEDEALETDLNALEKESNEGNESPQTNFKFNINIKPPTKLPRSITSFITPLKAEEFGPEFDVFDYAEKIGRENLLHQVFKVSINFKDVFNLLKSTKVDDYIEELRRGYISEKDAFYHNVSSIRLILLGLSCRGCSSRRS